MGQVKDGLHRVPWEARAMFQRVWVYQKSLKCRQRRVLNQIRDTSKQTFNRSRRMFCLELLLRIRTSRFPPMNIAQTLSRSCGGVCYWKNQVVKMNRSSHEYTCVSDSPGLELRWSAPFTFHKFLLQNIQISSSWRSNTIPKRRNWTEPLLTRLSHVLIVWYYSSQFCDYLGAVYGLS